MRDSQYFNLRPWARDQIVKYRAQKAALAMQSRAEMDQLAEDLLANAMFRFDLGLTAEDVAFLHEMGVRA